MNLIDEIQTVVKRHEDIKNLQVPDIDCDEEQIDDIENILFYEPIKRLWQITKLN